MDLVNSTKSISFFQRIVLQVPTIVFSVLTMIAISRNLGPTGRGEISQILLLAALTSSILCTPIFLNIMNLTVPTEIKSYIFSSLYLFYWKNLALVLLLDFCLIFFRESEKYTFSIQSIISLNLLIGFYFIATQIRDFLLRFHENWIYGLDFLVQLLISGSVLVLIFLHALTVSFVIQIFVINYGIFAISLSIILSRRITDFKFSYFVRKKKSNSISAEIQKTDASF